MAPTGQIVYLEDYDALLRPEPGCPRKGLENAEIVHAFHPHVLLLRELGRVKRKMMRVFSAGDGQVSLCGQLAEDESGFAPNILLAVRYSPRPSVSIAGDMDGARIACDLEGVRMYGQRTVEILFRPSPAFDLDLTPLRCTDGFILPQIGQVIIDTFDGRLRISNIDHGQYGRQEHSLWKTPQDG